MTYSFQKIKALKKINYFILFLLLAQIGLAQNFLVSGKVIDAQTKMPLQGASVFCIQTTIGTVTNSEGNFSMRLPNGGYELGVSFSGYETSSLRINDQTEGIIDKQWELKPKEKSLEEVSIVFSSEVKDGWEKYGDFFKSQFLGTSENAKSCTITNPEVLKFYYYKKKDKLKVISKEDILINNGALGYQIKYQLDSFIHEFKTGATESTGYPFFQASSGSEEDSLKWNENRTAAYYGSVLHFFRCYYDSTLNLNGYKIELVDEKTETPIQIKDPYDTSFYAKTSSNELDLGFPGKLRIQYKMEKPLNSYLVDKKLPLSTPFQISIIKFLNNIIIEENGYFYDQRDLFYSGYWDWEKLGDMLPYDFDL